MHNGRVSPRAVSSMVKLQQAVCMSDKALLRAANELVDEKAALAKNARERLVLAGQAIARELESGSANPARLATLRSLYGAFHDFAAAREAEEASAQTDQEDARSTWERSHAKSRMISRHEKQLITTELRRFEDRLERDLLQQNRIGS